MKLTYSAKGFGLGAVAILSIGLAVGNLVFAVVNRLMFDAPPFPDPHSLFFVGRDWNADGAGFRLDAQSFAALRESAWGALGLATVTPRTPGVIDGFGPGPVRVAGVSDNLLVVLGVNVIAGRGFSRADSGVRPTAMLLTDAAWRDRFGRSVTIIGSVFGVGRDAVRIVGVLPRTFILPAEFGDTQADAVVVDPDVAKLPISALKTRSSRRRLAAWQRG